MISISVKPMSMVIGQISALLLEYNCYRLYISVCSPCMYSSTADHTKFIGSFRSSQDLVDVIEVVYRGAMKGKLIVDSPLDPQSVTKYNLLYKDI